VLRRVRRRQGRQIGAQLLDARHRRLALRRLDLLRRLGEPVEASVAMGVLPAFLGERCQRLRHAGCVPLRRMPVRFR
jgi:hypothetical protein